MKVCIPVKENKGLESIPYGHFGSAPMFLIVNTDSNEVKLIDNREQHHAHGACMPTKSLNGQEVDAVIVGGIGSRAIARLNNIGIRVFRSEAGTVMDNISHIEDNKLTELTADSACGHHGHGCES